MQKCFLFFFFTLKVSSCLTSLKSKTSLEFNDFDMMNLNRTQIQIQKSFYTESDGRAQRISALLNFCNFAQSPILNSIQISRKACMIFK